MMIAVCAAFFLLLSAEVVDKVVAVVGDEVITGRELDAMYEQAGSELADSPFADRPESLPTRAEFLEHLIERKVIEQEVKKQGIQIDALEVEKAVDRKRESLGLTEEEFKRALAMQGVSLQDYREEVKNQLVTYRLISREVKGEIEVSDEQTRAFYNQNAGMFKGEDRYRLSHIFMPFPVSGATVAEKTVSELKGIRRRIIKGADFAEMARMYSKTPTASDGGDLGWFTMAELLPEFRTHVKRLEPGQVSPVFVHGNGAHIIRLEEVERGGKKSYEEVEEQIKDMLYQRETMERYDIWLERLKAKTHVENRLKQG